MKINKKEQVIIYFKMPFETKHFNKNQKVWVQMTTGAMAAKVAGRFRGKGKYVSAWVNWDKTDRKKYPLPEFKKIEMEADFIARHSLQAVAL